MKKTIVTAVFIMAMSLLYLMSGCSKKQLTPEPEIKADDPYMAEAINEALQGIRKGDGGPFGCVIVRDGEIVGRGHNMVLADNDSTAHGEITAIRDAEKKLTSYDLSGCILYTRGEPCPMCLYAILWANIDQVFYGCNIRDNAEIGFRDEEFDSLAGGREDFKDFLTCIDREACLELFRIYKEREHKHNTYVGTFPHTSTFCSVFYILSVRIQTKQVIYSCRHCSLLCSKKSAA